MAANELNVEEKISYIPESVRQSAKDVAFDLCYYFSGLKKLQRKPSSKHAKTMRRTVEEMSQKHVILFNSMIKKLDLKQENVNKVFYNIASEIFHDNHYNWGRVVSVYAFGARLAKHFAAKGETKVIDKVANSIFKFVDEKLSSWIHEQGGWDAFDEHFPEQRSMEDAVWNALLFTAIGLGALATVAAVR